MRGAPVHAHERNAHDASNLNRKACVPFLCSAAIGWTHPASPTNASPSTPYARPPRHLDREPLFTVTPKNTTLFHGFWVVIFENDVNRPGLFRALTLIQQMYAYSPKHGSTIKCGDSSGNLKASSGFQKINFRIPRDSGFYFSKSCLHACGNIEIWQECHACAGAVRSCTSSPLSVCCSMSEMREVFHAEL